MAKHLNNGYLEMSGWKNGRIDYGFVTKINNSRVNYSIIELLDQ